MLAAHAQPAAAPGVPPLPDDRTPPNSIARVGGNRTGDYMFPNGDDVPLDSDKLHATVRLSAASVNSMTSHDRAAVLAPRPSWRVDFTRPIGEPALAASDSVSWQVFKNPISLFIGGIAAVILELAEPRVRSGVWEHSDFRTDPIGRMRRTGLAAMVTVYGPESTAKAMIAGIGRMHAKVSGTTPAGISYRADDTELLDWVQATASFGFLEAYCAYVRPLSDFDRDRFYAESIPAARLFGAVGAPTSLATLDALFGRMRDKLEPSDIIFEFLDIVQRAPLRSGAGAMFVRPFLRAAIAILPAWVRVRLGLDRPTWTLGPVERAMVQTAGRLADKVALPSSPPVQASIRMGLGAGYLYRPRA